MILKDLGQFWLFSLFIMGWFIFFQYYWFPQLKPRHFLGNTVLLALAYAGLNVAAVASDQGVVTLLPPLALLGFEFWRLPKRYRRYFPTFIDATILTYLMTQCMDAISVTLTLWLTNAQFVTCFWGIVTVMLFDSIGFTVLALTLWVSQAPMENLIQSMMGRPSQYFLMAVLLGLGVIFLMLEASLQLVAGTLTYVALLAVMMSVLMIGLALSLYMLMLMHLQQEHAHARQRMQAYQEQYSTELERQMDEVRQFRHDYQNILLGLGGFLADRDYEHFRLMYIDIRSNWETSDAADLTIEDLENIDKDEVRYPIYHHYLMARQMGVELYVVVPTPLNETLEVLRQLGQIVDRSLPLVLAAVQQMQPPTVTLELHESTHHLYYRLTFPVSEEAQVQAHYRLKTAQTTLNFAAATRGITLPIEIQLRVKRHWGQYSVTIPRN